MNIEKLRDIRNLESINLKPSEYLKANFTDDSGNERPVILREYQKKHILEMCISPRHINGADTGLGKTVMVLSTIGYVWMEEPEYVPIILTTKSALFQWEAECYKFMQGMKPIVVHGEPHERDRIYEDFFTQSNEKRLLLMTYDTLFRDLDAAVIRDKGHKASAADKKALKLTRADEKKAKERLELLSSALKDVTDARTFEDSEYVFARMNGRPASRASTWSNDDEKALTDVIAARDSLKKISTEVQRLTDLVSPPMRTAGILERVLNLKAHNPNIKFMMAMDEVHKLKNYRSQVHEKTRALSLHCDRLIGMTATPVKNRLMEFFGIFRIINPALFPKVTDFQAKFCVMKLQRVPGGRQVPIVVGYKNLDAFVNQIEPYFLARKKQDVVKELPELISVEVQCELSDIQDDLYDMAENGVDNLTDDDSYSNVLSSLVMCQQAVNAPQLILNEEGTPFEGRSTKLDTLMDLLEDDLAEQKVIIFSRFEKMISLIEAELKKSKTNYVRITGKENDPKYRQAAREKFQDPRSGVNVILITMAGSESLNLQAAEHFIFIDIPWSFGDYVQLIGRMIRIGSSHKTVVAHHFLGKRIDGSSTIDHHVLKALQSKKKLSDKVSGEAIKGGLQFESQDAVQDVLAAMKKGGIPQNTKKTHVKSPAKPTKLSSSPVTLKSKPKTLSKDTDHQVESLVLDLSDV